MDQSMLFEPKIDEGLDIEFVQNEDRYKCVLCQNVLRKAMQTLCGHRICEQCLNDHIKRGMLTCPALEQDCEEISTDNVFPDKSIRKEINKLLVYCPYKRYDCKDKFPYEFLNVHIANCLHSVINCPNKDCPQRIHHSKLSNHIRECEFSLIPCPYCRASLLLRHKIDHIDRDCPEVPAACPYQCETDNLTRNTVEEHKATCKKRPVTCTYHAMGCSFQGTGEEVSKHEETKKDYHLSMLVKQVEELANNKKEIAEKCKILSESRESLMAELVQLKAQNNSLQKSVDTLSEKFFSTERQITEMQNATKDNVKKIELAVHDSILQSLQDDHTKIKSRITNLESKPETNGASASNAPPEGIRAKLQQVEHELGVNNIRLAEADLRLQCLETASYDGILIWKVRDYKRRKGDAISGKTVSLYSQPFYTSRFGYKMCARVYLNGDGLGKGNYLSLFFVIMRGEYDALLPWPFKQKVTFTLLSQDPAANSLMDMFKPDVSSTSFKKPTTDMNVASGCPQFVAKTVLESNDFLRDDCIFLKVQVDTSTLS